MKVASLLLALVLGVSVFAVEKPVDRGMAGIDTGKELLLPSNYRNWVVVSPATLGVPQHKHKHVASKLYVEPSSYEQFSKTGAWPNKTVIVMELLSEKAVSKGTCDLMGLEAAVKDDSGFPDPWSYYGIVYDRDKAPAKMIHSDCAECGVTIDSVLTMAFPTLRAVINGKPSTVGPSLL